jgi:hypothetical protein
MSKADELERTAAFRATVRFPSPARLAVGRQRLLAAAMAEQGRAGGAQPARQRWRRPVLAGGLAVAAATAVTTLVLTSGPAAPPEQHATAGHTRTVVTAAWTVRLDADGTVTVDIKKYIGPAGLQTAVLEQTLRADGVNAIIRAVPITHGHTACVYNLADAAPLAVQQAVLPNDGLDIPPRGDSAMVIHPGSMPHGSALFMQVYNFPSAKPGQAAFAGLNSPVVLNNDTVPACVSHLHLPKSPRSGA